MYFYVTDPEGGFLNLDTVTSLLDLKNTLSTVNGDVAVILIIDNISYLGVKGRSGIFLKREGKEVPVVTTDDKVVGASGRNNAHNIFILKAGSNSKEYTSEPKSPGFGLQKLIPKKDFYLKGWNIKQPVNLNINKKAAGVILVIIFLIYAVFRQVSYRLENDRGIKTDREIAKVEEKVNAAMELAMLNKVLARENLEAQKKSLQSFDGDQKKILAEITKIDAKIKEVLAINSINPEIFYDFSLAKEGVVQGPGYYLDGKLSFLDKNSGTLLSLDVKNKSGKVVAADEKFRNSEFVSGTTDRVYVFGSEGIFRVNLSNSKKDLVIKKSDKWQEVTSMVAFAGNIYLLDKKADQIWKHVSTDAGFTEPKNYLVSGIEVDFSNATGMNINGSIFVTDPGKIQKFTQGRKEDFNLLGLDKPVGKITQIAASDDLENIYLWDELNRRVIVVSESGQYLSQYIIMGDSIINGLFVDETLNKIFLLSGAKVYGVDLK